MIDVLSDLFILRGIPGHIRSDNGPEFVAEAVPALGWKRVHLAPGDPAADEEDDGREISADDVTVRIEDAGTLAVTIGERNIAEVGNLSIRKAAEFFRKVELTAREQLIAERVLKEVNERLRFLLDVGLDYLTLDRAAVLGDQVGYLFQQFCGVQDSDVCVRGTPLPGDTLGPLQSVNSSFINIGEQSTNGVDVSVLVSRELHFDNFGKPITTSLTDHTRQLIRGKFPSLQDFLNRWNATDRLSGDLCSLHEGVARACLAVRMKLDRGGHKIGHRFVRGMMRSAVGVLTNAARDLAARSLISPSRSGTWPRGWPRRWARSSRCCSTR